MVLSGCEDPVNKEMINSITPLVDNLKRHYPDFVLKLDALPFDSLIYSNKMYPDTTNCHSFWYNRSFMGVVDKLPAIANKNRSSPGELYLTSGNLDLWVCNLPPEINSGDTIFISGHIYDIFGNEKTWGLPTILTNVIAK